MIDPDDLHRIDPGVPDREVVEAMARLEFAFPVGAAADGRYSQRERADEFERPKQLDRCLPIRWRGTSGPGLNRRAAQDSPRHA